MDKYGPGVYLEPDWESIARSQASSRLLASSSSASCIAAPTTARVSPRSPPSARRSQEMAVAQGNNKKVASRSQGNKASGTPLQPAQVPLEVGKYIENLAGGARFASSLSLPSRIARATRRYPRLSQPFLPYVPLPVSKSFDRSPRSARYGSSLSPQVARSTRRHPRLSSPSPPGDQEDVLGSRTYPIITAPVTGLRLGSHNPPTAFSQNSGFGSAHGLLTSKVGLAPDGGPTAGEGLRFSSTFPRNLTTSDAGPVYVSPTQDT